ncbi:MAG: bifunctional metallophosphatase/5'-nucleotidase [Solirubrobacterales bacterium]
MTRLHGVRLGLAVTALAAILAFVVSGPAVPAASESELTILFTHDLHSHFDPQMIAVSRNKVVERGGYSRLATLIGRERATHPDRVLLLDAGDFSMGTLYHTLFRSQAAELRMLGQLGYDAATFGNHELDFDTKGLAQMLTAAQKSGDRLPLLVSANLSAASADSGLRQSLNAYPVKPYTIIERNGLKIGIFGIFGKDAAHDLIWAKDLKTADPVTAARQTVQRLRDKEKADLVICLSHTGTSAVKEDSEDELLAEQVKGIDLIISGHSHTRLTKPIIANGTIIASSGGFGLDLGELKLRVQPGRRPELASYRLIAVTPDIPNDPTIAQSILKDKAQVDAMLASSGYQSDQVLLELKENMDTYAEMDNGAAEARLGDLIADSFRDAIQKAEGPNGDFLNATVVPMGEIRGTLTQGNVSVKNVFEVLSLGMGPDRTAGYPLVSFYLNGQEIKNCLETQSTLAPAKSNYNLQVSGARFAYNPNRVPFDRVYAIQINTPRGMETLQPDQLYRIGTSYMTAVMMNKMGAMSYGIISVVPKDRNGRPIKAMTDALVDADASRPGVQELKEWLGLAAYLKGLPDTNGNGIADLPVQYEIVGGRYQAVASWRPDRLLSHATRLTWGFLGTALALLAILTAIGRWIWRRIRRSKTARLEAETAISNEPGSAE